MQLLQHSSIGLALPNNIYLMTFEPWKDGSFLIRFEHILEKDEDPQLSAPTRFNLSDVFPGYDIDLKEVTLSANQYKEDYQRLHFKEESSDFLDAVEKNTEKHSLLLDMEITLNPMEIRTFIMFLNPQV